MEKELTCTTCNTLFNDPMMMPCFHPICGSCGSRGDLTCTVCGRKSHSKDLKRHAALRNIVERYKLSKGGQAGNSGEPVHIVQCGMCDEATATLECEQCGVAYCSACKDKFHPSKGALATHVINKVGSSSKKRVTPCSEHADQSLSLYCLDCDKGICAFCILGTHKSHKYQKLEETFGDKQKSANNKLQQVHAVQIEVNNFIQTLEAMTADVGKKSIEFSNQVQNEFASFRAQLEEKEKILLEHIKKAREAKERQLGEQLAQRKKIAANFSAVHVYGTEAIKEVDAVTFLEGYNSLITKLSKATDTYKAENPCVSDTSPELKLESGSLNQSLKSLNFSGKSGGSSSASSFSSTPSNTSSAIEPKTTPPQQTAASTPTNTTKATPAAAATTAATTTAAASSGPPNRPAPTPTTSVAPAAAAATTTTPAASSPTQTSSEKEKEKKSAIANPFKGSMSALAADFKKSTSSSASSSPAAASSALPASAAAAPAAAAANAPPKPSSKPKEDNGIWVTATFEHEPDEPEELPFPAGARIKVIEKNDSGWWTGEYNGKTGIFPSNYTKEGK